MLTRRSFIFTLPLLVALCAWGMRQGTPPQEVEMLSNPTFAGGARGWALRSATPDSQVRHGQSASVRLEGVHPGPQSWSHAGTVLRPVPTNQELHFSCFVRGGGQGQTVEVNAFAYDKGRQLTANWHTTMPVSEHEWKSFSAAYNAPSGSTLLTIWVINTTSEPMFVADAHLTTGAAKKSEKSSTASLGGPGIIHAMAQAAVRPATAGAAGTVTFPIPGTYREQVPLSFDLHVTPPSALKGYRWRKRADGLNWLCEVTVAPPAKGAVVKWEALVLVGERPEAQLPRAPKPEAPQEAAAWTRSTACVQSADPAIRAKAEELGKGVDDVADYARRVIQFTSTNQGKGVAFDALDARKALDCGGSCTSRANLAAALLRARGIPARTIAHLPTWSGPLYEHWLVEYWHPGAGWIWLESTLGRFQPAPWTLAVLNVANPADEDRAFDPVHLRYVMPGAAYLSVAELSKELYAADLFKDDAMNLATQEAAVRGSAEEMRALFAAARTSYQTLAKRSQTGEPDAGRAKRVLDAARSGKAADLTAALQQR